MPACVPVTNLGAGKTLHPQSCTPIYKEDKFVFPSYFVCSLLLNISPWCLLSLIVSQYIRAAKTKCLIVSSLIANVYFTPFWRLGSSRWRCLHIWFLDCTQITFCSILTWQFSLFDNIHGKFCCLFVYFLFDLLGSKLWGGSTSANLAYCHVLVARKSTYLAHFGHSGSDCGMNRLSYSFLASLRILCCQLY